jgi:hypothetical protein
MPLIHEPAPESRCTRRAAGRRPWLPVALAVFVAVGGAVAVRRAQAAGGKARTVPRFFEGLLGKEPTPDFIPLPQPPTAEEAERAARLAAAP